MPWIEAHADDRFYLFIHSLDAHRPFAPPELPPHLRSDVADDSTLYDAEIYFNDQQIRRLYAVLEQKAIARDTLLIVTADHGDPDHLEDPMFNQAEMYGVVEGPWKLIVRQGADQVTPGVELCDLSTDPHETHDLSDVERGRTQALRGKLAEFLAQQQRARRSFIDNHTFDSVSASTARDTLEGVWDHLRGLGYIR